MSTDPFRSPDVSAWLTGGYRKGKDLPESKRRERMAARSDALGALADEAGLSLIHLALAFALQHPAVTAPIIGLRTLEHLESQLGATDVTLSVEVLDKIDEIVRPGVTISRADAGYEPPSLTDPFLRRRRTL